MTSNRKGSGLRRCAGAVLILGPCLLTGLGCSKSNRPPIAPVSGMVVLDGAALPGAQVVFTPDVGRLASGSTDSEGRFQLTTSKLHDGAAVGKHRVSVTKRVVNRKIPGDKGTSAIPADYESPATSGLEREVTADGPNDFKIELSRSGP